MTWHRWGSALRSTSPWCGGFAEWRCGIVVRRAIGLAWDAFMFRCHTLVSDGPVRTWLRVSNGRPWTRMSARIVATHAKRSRDSRHCMGFMYKAAYAASGSPADVRMSASGAPIYVAAVAVSSLVR